MDGWAGWDLHRIERGHDGDPPTGILVVHRLLKVRHDGNGSHQGAIIAVGASAAESNENAPWLLCGQQAVTLIPIPWVVNSQYRCLVVLLHLGILDSAIAAYSSA